MIGNYRVYDTFISDDKQRQEEIGVQLNMLPDHTIDFSFIQKQIQDKIGAFDLSLSQFLRLVGGFYAALDKLSLPEMQRLIDKDIDRKSLTEDDLWEYYSNAVSGNENNPFYQAGITWEEFRDFTLSPNSSGKRKIVNGKSYQPSNFRANAKEYFRNQAYNEANKARLIAAGVKTGDEKLDSQIKTNPDDKTNPLTSLNTQTNDQNAYSSVYNKTAARPTQIVFNINNLANFDRTMISSNAEDKDLITSMEERISRVVYQLFAEAANSAQNTIG